MEESSSHANEILAEINDVNNINKSGVIINEKNQCLDLNQLICRICLGISPETMISPCRCAGTSQYCHHECLKIWIQQKFQNSDNPNCEICRETYNIQSNYKFKVKFKRNEEERSYYLCCILFLVLLILSTAITFFFIVSDYLFDMKKEIASTIITLTLCTVGVIGFIVLLIMVIRHGFRLQRVNDMTVMNYPSGSSKRQENLVTENS